jgi:hypothetical protein
MRGVYFEILHLIIRDKAHRVRGKGAKLYVCLQIELVRKMVD